MAKAKTTSSPIKVTGINNTRINQRGIYILNPYRDNLHQKPVKKYTKWEATKLFIKFIFDKEQQILMLNKGEGK